MPDPKPKRRFRFSLRTLFVVVTLGAVFLGWLESERRFITKREACRTRFAESRKKNELGWAVPYTDSSCMNGPDFLPEWAAASQNVPTIPFWRRWLGDEPYGIVSVPAEWPETELREIKTIFPEAFVYSLRDYPINPNARPREGR